MPQRPLLIALCGPEGTGKSTNREFIVQLARSHGLDACGVTSHELSIGTLVTRVARRLGILRKKDRFSSEFRGIGRGRTEGPTTKDRMLRRRLRSFRRSLSYFGDAVIFRLYLRFGSCRSQDLVVADRYLYDSMARLTDDLPSMIGWLAFMSRRPDVAFLLSGRPNELLERRPGSTLEYHEMVQARYTALGHCCPELIQLPAADLQSTQLLIRQHLEPLLLSFARRSGSRIDEGRLQ